MLNYDVKYTIKLIKRPDGKTEYGVYENNNIVDSFLSYERAVQYLEYYKRAMR